MLLPSPLDRGTLLRRYKRFLADVLLETGEQVTAWCPNPGAMTGCAFPGEPVWLSHDPSPKRKLQWTWELARDPGTGGMILVNTQRPNALAEEGVRSGLIVELQGYGSLRREVRYGEGSRVDLFLEEPQREGLLSPCLVEVKSTTLPVGGGVGAFPDSRTVRGRKHLAELTAEVAAGRRAVQLFLASRSDLEAVRPADEVDPAYGEALRRAAAAGVEVLAYGVSVGLEEIHITARLPVLL